MKIELFEIRVLGEWLVPEITEDCPTMLASSSFTGKDKWGCLGWVNVEHSEYGNLTVCPKHYPVRF